jgi:hypothetical protein
MGVAADDGVHAFGDTARELDDLSAATRRRFGFAERAGVRHDHDELRAAGAHCPGAPVDDRNRVDEPQVGDVGGLGGGRCRDRRDANHTDFQRSDRQHRVVRNPGDIPAPGVGHVGAEDRVSRIAHAGAQRVLSPVELVVA